MNEVVTTTPNVTINAAFLMDIKENNQQMRESLAALTEMCGRTMSLTDHCFEFIGRLRDLRDQVALHFTLEEAVGYFDGPEDVVPFIAQQADTLRRQHTTLYRELDRLTEQAEELLFLRDLAALTSIIPVAFDSFAAQLEEHESAENALLMEAWNQDIGVGD